MVHALGCRCELNIHLGNISNVCLSMYNAIGIAQFPSKQSGRAFGYMVESITPIAPPSLDTSQLLLNYPGLITKHSIECLLHERRAYYA